MSRMKYAQVILPLAVESTFTYWIPDELESQVQIGRRVEVEFGKRKRYAGVVHSVTNEASKEYSVKPIIDVLDREALIDEEMLAFWSWMAEYYMCSIGEVMAAALPASFRLTSETIIRLSDEFKGSIYDLSSSAQLLITALNHREKLTMDEASAVLQRRQIYGVLNDLLKADAITVSEKLVEKYRPKKTAHIRLALPYRQNESAQVELLDNLHRAAKQQAVVLLLLDYSDKEKWQIKKEVETVSKAAHSVLKALQKKGIIEWEERKVEEVNTSEEEGQVHKLNNEQQAAVEKILSGKKVSLLHGITGSGKTHVYIELIKKCLNENGQTLYLLPEIALTGQIIKRLRLAFGPQVAVFHSRFNERERRQTFNKIRSGECKIVLGARSALFLPFKNLQLIIVDEEHDGSYKQTNPAPRYHARDAAIYLANSKRIPIVLGSATPSFESMFNAEQGRYQLVELKQRFGNLPLPRMDMVNLYDQKIPSNKYFKYSKRLIDELKACLNENKQAILFQNRRGYSSFMQCAACRESIQCINCDVSLTYHKFRNDLECHYCGHRESPAIRCPNCTEKQLQYIGLGTQRIEEELQEFLPKARIQRMDWDSTRTKMGHQRIIDKFEEGAVDILVGTQMVTKGLDFANVKLVGILDADAVINFPDIRSAERAFQLMEQVSGRSGRKKGDGRVIIQIRNDHYPVLQHVIHHDYHGFYKNEMQERKLYRYPPYYRMVKLTIKHRVFRTCQLAGLHLATALKPMNELMKGPAEPLISRINNQYIQEILIFIPRKADRISNAKMAIRQAVKTIKSHSDYKQVRINIDVDPV